MVTIPDLILQTLPLRQITIKKKTIEPEKEKTLAGEEEYIELGFEEDEAITEKEKQVESDFEEDEAKEEAKAQVITDKIAIKNFIDDLSIIQKEAIFKSVGELDEINQINVDGDNIRIKAGNKNIELSKNQNVVYDKYFEEANTSEVKTQNIFASRSFDEQVEITATEDTETTITEPTEAKEKASTETEDVKDVSSEENEVKNTEENVSDDSSSTTETLITAGEDSLGGLEAFPSYAGEDITVELDGESDDVVLEGLNERLIAAQEEKADKEDELSENQDEFEKVNNEKTEELSSIDAEIETSEGELESANKDLTTAETQRDEAQQEVDETQAQVNESEAAKNEAGEELTAANENVVENQGNVDTASESREDAVAALTDANNDFTDASDKLEIENDDVRAAQGNANTANTDLDKAQIAAANQVKVTNRAKQKAQQLQYQVDQKKAEKKGWLEQAGEWVAKQWNKLCQAASDAWNYVTEEEKKERELKKEEKEKYEISQKAQEKLAKEREEQETAQDIKNAAEIVMQKKKANLKFPIKNT